MRNFKLDKYMEDLEYLVNIDSGSRYVAGITKIADYFTEEFEKLGFTVKRHDLDEAGPLLEIRNHPDEKEIDALFVGHMDTVFENGTVAEWGFSSDGEKAYGPGVIDMKSGLLSIREIMKNIDEETLNEVKFCILMNPDEEISSYKSKYKIKEIAQDTKFAFVMEPGRVGGQLVKQRKGLAKYEFEYFGRAAHSGVDPENGRNANLELARFTLELDKLVDLKAGLNLNMGVIEGGTVPNVVSEHAKSVLDIRYEKAEQLEKVLAEIERLQKDAKTRDIRVEVEELGERPPMMPTEKTEELIEFYNEVAKTKGKDLEWVATGGGSDGNFLAFEGVTTIDALGPVGGGGHSRREYIEIDSIEERLGLMVALMNEMYKEKMFK